MHSWVNPDRNIFSINVELTSTVFALQRFGPSPSPNFMQMLNIFSQFWFYLIKTGILTNINITDHILEILEDK